MLIYFQHIFGNNWYKLKLSVALRQKQANVLPTQGFLWIFWKFIDSRILLFFLHPFNHVKHILNVQRTDTKSNRDSINYLLGPFTAQINSLLKQLLRHAHYSYFSTAVLSVLYLFYLHHYFTIHLYYLLHNFWVVLMIIPFLYNTWIFLLTLN